MPNQIEYTEQELPVLISAGNMAAFKQIYKAHYRKVYAYARKFTKSTELAEDLTQEVFIKIWEYRANLSEVKNLQGYLFAVCKNLTLNVISRAAKEEKIRSQILEATPLADPGTENEIQLEEYEAFLNQAIEQLPPKRKLIFKRCKIEGASYQKVAAQANISVGTVNDHIVKATRFIIDYLKRYNILID